MTGLRVLISTSSFGAADAAPLALLESAGVTVERNPYGRVLTEDEAAALLSDVDAVIAGTEPLSARVLGAAPRLRVISRVGIGLESVDLDAASSRGIRVLNTPDAATDAAAELTVAGILSLLRHVHELDAALRTGRWEKRLGRLLSGRTVGIVGAGRIGKRVAALLDPFGVRLLACDVALDAAWAASAGVTPLPLEELLRRSEIVTLHASGNRRIVGTDEIALMPEGALLVNVARGALVDEEALYAALASGRLGGCYLDVFEREPYDGPLLGLPGTLLTPHVGSYAREARVRMELEAVENVLRALEDPSS